MDVFGRIQDEDRIDKLKGFYHRIAETNEDYFNFWMEYTFLRWDFWMAISLTILPWVLWGFLHQRESRMRQLTVGFYMIIVTSWLDFLGSTKGFWVYTGNAFPTIPAFMPWDFSVFPVIVMLLLQYKPRLADWKKGLIFAGGSTFIGEPLFIWIGLYIPIKWFPLLSFPIYFLLFIIAAKIGNSTHYEPVEKAPGTRETSNVSQVPGASARIYMF